MPFGLISLHDELRLFAKLHGFYSKLYPKVKFSKGEKVLKPKEVGDILYTYAGEETEALAAEKMREIINALPEYAVPAILLKKGKSLIVLDGHRRLRVAWKRQLPWKVLLLVPDSEVKFGIEETVVGTIRSLYQSRTREKGK
jgi:hypothetical protein